VRAELGESCGLPWRASGIRRASRGGRHARRLKLGSAWRSWRGRTIGRDIQTFPSAVVVGCGHVNRYSARAVDQNQARIACPRSPQKINQRPAARTISSCSAIATGSAAFANPKRERMVRRDLDAEPAVSATSAAARSACPYEIAASGNLLFHASSNKSLPSTPRQSVRKAPRKLVSSIPSYRPPRDYLGTPSHLTRRST
jgi:hypothetical protein